MHIGIGVHIIEMLKENKIKFNFIDELFYASQILNFMKYKTSNTWDETCIYHNAQFMMLCNLVS